MQLAFTGSRNGPFPRQRDTLQQTLFGLRTGMNEPAGEPLLLRHGDCIGGDAAAHDIADALNYMIIIHPGIVPKHLRAFKAQRMTNDRPPIIVLEPKPPLVRNRDMVDLSERLLALPDTFHDKPYGGTWYTIRYAMRQGRDVLLIFPDGSTRLEVGTAPRSW